MDGDAFDGNFLVCGADSHELTFMSAGDRPGSDEFVLFGDGVLDDEAQIGKGGQVHGDLNLVGFRADGGTGKVVVAHGVAGRNKIAQPIEFTFVPYLFVQATDDSLGVDGHAASFAWM